ncbi:hypothetical protein [Pseudonocardia acaciae]|uniref:hypothetical protein n=1 Tax=Pseudonocardia acaciae TaxID=551276 RepID=UPI001FDFB572|nr:hypothetical protein [Pseudonocardia acaciae]
MAVTEPAVDANRTDAPDPTPDPELLARASRLLEVTAPALVFLGVRLVGVLILGWQTEVNGGLLLSRLSVWDGQWMLAIAGGGYSGVPHGLVDAFGHRDPTTPLAFFPGYPAAVAVVRFVTGANLVVAGLMVSLVAGVVLAYGLARLGELVPGGSRRVGLLLVALVAAAPMGVVWSMTYSEGLFCAFVVWALVAVLRRNWVLAGCCTALAGTIRPTGAALLLAVGLAALVTVFRREDGWRPWVGGMIAPLGLVGYLGFVASRTGSLGGWFELQERGWSSGFDGGAATWAFTEEVLASGRSVLEVVTVGVLVGAVVLLAVCWARRVPWPLIAYAAGVLAMTLASNGLMNSKARLALPAVTLLVPVALALAKRRRATAMAVLTAVTLASAWFGGYALTGWSYAI